MERCVQTALRRPCTRNVSAGWLLEDQTPTKVWLWWNIMKRKACFKPHPKQLWVKRKSKTGSYSWLLSPKKTSKNECKQTKCFQSSSVWNIRKYSRGTLRPCDAWNHAYGLPLKLEQTDRPAVRPLGVTKYHLLLYETGNHPERQKRTPGLCL